MDLKNSRIVVIGGAGFVGSHTVELLLEEGTAEVLVVDSFLRGKQANLPFDRSDPRLTLTDVPTDILRTDLLDACIAGADGIVHLAAVWLTHSEAHPRSAMDVNVMGTFNVFEACLREKVKRVVFASSASVYGNAMVKPMTEEHPLANTTVYGATKICAEAIGNALLHSQRLPLAYLRYFNIYGPRQDTRGAYNSVIVKMLDAAERNQPLTVYGDGTQSYDFVSVRDIARANVCALKADQACGAFNVCTGVSTSINELAATVIELTRSRSTIRHLPDANSFVTDRVGCPRKAREQLGFTTRWSFLDGMRDFCEWRAAQGASRGVA